MSARLLVETPGLATTVQDLGRWGYQALGVSVSGALDRVAVRLANALVGNPEGTAGLEIRFQGPRLKVVGGSLRVALSGTSIPLRVLEPEPFSVPAFQSVTLPEGARFEVPATPDSAVCFLAIAGGLALDAPLGSQATYAPASLGGVAGRGLEAGDSLALRQEVPPSGELRLAEPWDQVEPRLYGLTGAAIRLVLGPQAHQFPKSVCAKLWHETYGVSPRSNRMALALDGPALVRENQDTMLSDGIVMGSIQVPASGQPFILLADRQTTGGYPKIATVASADLPRLVRALPGAQLRFEAVEVEAAEAARRAQEMALKQAIAGLEAAQPSAQQLNERLREHNLISGVVG